MIVVYRPTDRIPVRMGGATFWVSPLTNQQYAEVMALVQMRAGEEKVEPMALARKTLKFSLKEVEGLSYASGEPYVLSFDESGNLSDECVEDFIRMNGSANLITVCGQFSMNGVRELTLEGVEVDLKGTKSVKKN